MEEITGDLFAQPCDAIVVTTNGYVNNRKIQQYSQTCRQLTHIWDGWRDPFVTRLTALGNSVWCPTLERFAPSITGLKGHLVLFPTKPSVVYPSDKENLIKEYLPKGEPPLYLPGWASKSNLNIIRHSLEELVALTDREEWSRVCLPRVGCGTGQLKWPDVKPILEQVLDDRFRILKISSKQDLTISKKLPPVTYVKLS